MFFQIGGLKRDSMRQTQTVRGTFALVRWELSDASMALYISRRIRLVENSACHARVL